MKIASFNINNINRRLENLLHWLLAHAAELYSSGAPVVLAGDYNVVPTDLDIYPTKSWDRNACCSLRAARRIRPFSRRAGPTPFERSIPKNASIRFGITCGNAGTAMAVSPS
jgi:exonuclease III